MPADANNFLASGLCAHQAFVIERRGFAHLGMQFHCEMTAELIEDWARSGGAEIQAEVASTGGPDVQDPSHMVRRASERAARMHQWASRLYHRWSEGLAR